MEHFDFTEIILTVTRSNDVMKLDQNCSCLFIISKKMLRKIVQKIKKHRYKILAGVSFIAAGYFFYYSLSDDKTIKLSTFFDALKSDQINEIVVKGDIIYFRSATSDWYHSFIGNYPLFDLFNIIKAAPDVSFSCEAQAISPMLLVPVVVPLAGLYLLYKSLPSQYGKGVYKQQKKANTLQRFQNYYGGEKIKTYLREAIEFMKYPDRFQKYGLRIRRGILLHGPPGTGKTMLARILANEAGLQFFSASASEFQQIFVGVGPKRIRDIFEKARSVQKGAIIFIDEIDAIGSRAQHWQTKQQRSTINQLLTEIDGFTQNNRIFIVGATNNISLVDEALLRPGRFDLKIFVPIPNEEQRCGILQTLMKAKHVQFNIKEEDLRWVAKNTNGWCGADLQNLLNQSGYCAMRKEEDKITFETLKETIHQVSKKNAM